MSTQTKIKVQGIRMEQNGGPEVLKFAFSLELTEPGCQGQAFVKIHPVRR